MLTAGVPATQKVLRHKQRVPTCRFELISQMLILSSFFEELESTVQSCREDAERFSERPSQERQARGHGSDSCMYSATRVSADYSAVSDVWNKCRA